MLALDVLQQLVKSQRENVTEMIEAEQRQIDTLKTGLDEEVRRNEELETDCLSMESKVQLVLSNHKMVQEHLARHYGYQRIELMPGMSGSTFSKLLYERMVSIFYEEPQYLSVTTPATRTPNPDPKPNPRTALVRAPADPPSAPRLAASREAG